MKLEKYLADYLATGIERLHEQGLPMDFTVEGLQEIIKYGLDTFESTEDARIITKNKKYYCDKVCFAKRKGERK